MTGRRIFITGLVIALSALAGCSDGSAAIDPVSTRGPAGPIPVSAPDVVEAGGPIAEGYTVPEGAVLLGQALPKGVELVYRGMPVVDRGWDAYLVVPGDPRAVVRSLVDEAQADGFDVRSFSPLDSDRWPAGSLCGDTDDGYRCWVIGFAPATDATRTISIELVRRPALDRARVPGSWLHVSYSDSVRPEGTFAAEFPLSTIAGGGPEAPKVPSGMVLPQPGDLVGEEFAGLGVFRFEIEPGSRAIGPVLEHPEGVAYTLVLAVTGDLDEVVAAYLEQNDGRELQEPRTTEDGTEVRTYGGGGAGGSEFVLNSIDPPSGPALVRLKVLGG